MAKRQSSSLLPSASELRLIIGMLTLIKVAKYLPHIVFASATVSLTLAILDFAVWDNLAFGVVNTILAIGGFVFAGQLQRPVTRYKYTARRHRITGSAPEIEPRMNVQSYNQRLRDQEAA